MGSLGKKVDLISKNYACIERTEQISKWIYWFGAVLSIILLLGNSQFSKNVYFELTQNVFLASIIILFILNLILRFYMVPRAEESRIKDFLSSAYGVNLISVPTSGYYNNNATQPIHRLALQLLENTFFTKRIIAEELIPIRWQIGLYVFALLIVFVSTKINCEWKLIVCGIFFGEEVLSKYIRMEWLRIRADHIYEDMHRIFCNEPNNVMLEIQVLEKFSIYERIKSMLAVTLSSRYFNKLNDGLSREWTDICKNLEACRGIYK